MMSVKHRLTDRDTQLTDALRLCRAMTTHQIQTLFYPGPSGSRCRERLKFLTDTKQLKRVELPSLLSEGRKPYVYMLPGEKLNATHLFLSHVLNISEVYVRLLIACKQYGYELQDWTNDATLKKLNMIDTFEIENSKGVKYTASLVPDASFVITTPERPFRFLLEVDKGTETLRDIAEKFIKYRYYFQPIHGPSVYEKRYGTDRGRVLCIAPTLQRLKNIKDVCEAQGGKTRYWFTVMSELQTNNVFTAPGWYKGGSDETFSLL